MLNNKREEEKGQNKVKEKNTRNLGKITQNEIKKTQKQKWDFFKFQKLILEKACKISMKSVEKASIS